MYYMPSPFETRWIVGTHSIKDSIYVRQQSYKTKDYDLHPLWVAGKLFDNYDVALITTDRRIQFNSGALPICLPKTGDEKLFFNNKVIVAGTQNCFFMFWDFQFNAGQFKGWGRTEENGAQTDVLMETNVYLKSHRECKKLADAIKYDDRSMLCAHEHYTDACQVCCL